MLTDIGGHEIRIGRDRLASIDSEIDAVDPDVLAQRLSELDNCLANTSINFLKRPYDGTPICERYRNFEELHIHYVTSRDAKCLRWRCREFQVLELLYHFDEFAMPIGVGELAEKLEWLPSVVRLKPLEKCEMFTGYSPQKSVTILNKLIWTAFTRKLDGIRGSARVLLSNSAVK